MLLALSVGALACRGERALGDCEYVEAVRTVFQGFSHSLTAAGLQLSITGPAATAEQRAAAARALDELNVELGRLLDDLRRLRIGGDLRPVNAALVATSEDIRRQLLGFQALTPSPPAPGMTGVESGTERACPPATGTGPVLCRAGKAGVLRRAAPAYGSGVPDGRGEGGARQP